MYISSCSKNVVAGRTISAMAAVSVINCSWTQTKRSSLSNPSRTLSEDGETIIGLVFWINMAVTGGPPCRSIGLPHKTSPIRDWSKTLIPLSKRSAPIIRDLSSGKSSALLYSAPPPRYFHAPVTAGMHETACMLNAPFRVRVKPYPKRKNVFGLFPTSLANSTICSDGTPVISSAHIAVLLLKCVSSSLPKSVYSSR